MAVRVPSRMSEPGGPRRLLRKLVKRTLAIAVITLLGPCLVVACGKVNLARDWRTADRSPQHIAPTGYGPDNLARATVYRFLFGDA